MSTIGALLYIQAHAACFLKYHHSEIVIHKSPLSYRIDPSWFIPDSSLLLKTGDHGATCRSGAANGQGGLYKR